ncbi:MAG: hypothetical protein Q8P40_13050 [Nitrospirota bacterium]|nr:hypothetical protein [Nitrospirota bacterium]
MRTEEAEEVIKIILQCDGGCEYCVSSLLKLFSDKFPEYESIAKLAFKEKFGIALEDFLDKNTREIWR